MLYPFGHGLSFTTFNYATPSLSAAAIKVGDAVTARVNITNSGQQEGEEVVQLYVAKPNDPANPTLAGFARVNVKAGETKAVSINLDARALSLVDAKGIRKVQAGDYTLHLGGGQPKYVKAATAKLTVTGEAELPK